MNESRFETGKLKPNDRLNPILWANGHPSPKIIQRLLEISGDIVDKIKTEIEIEDIILTGSMCGYNWHSESDIDLHFVVDFSKLSENFNLVKQMLDEFRINWNKKHDIMFGQHELEIYFQDINETNESNGIYSISRGEWLAEPVRLDPELQLNIIEKKAETIAKATDHCNELFKQKKYSEAHEYASKLMQKIKRMRQAGLSEEGIYSVENLAFKMLRNAGFLELITKIRDKSYDMSMSMSLEENILKKDINIQISKYFDPNITEAAQDAKILRKINVDHIKQEMPPLPQEEVRKYFERLTSLERDPQFLNPIFPTGLVTWVESLPDNHFPNNGRKRFAKWLGNAVYRQETDVNNNIDSVDNPEELSVYNNDVRYIADYFNGAQDIPQNIWDMTFPQVLELSEEWHEQFKGREDSTGPYQTKNVVYDFENGFTIVEVPSEDLGTEGDNMGHCVGGYCDAVESGMTIIYSLRDRNNKPHATIEVEKTRYETVVHQIKGKGNDAPVPKYRPMIKQWLKTTNLNYHDSHDYQNILSLEDYQADLEGDKFFKNFRLTVRAAESQDPEVVRYVLGRYEAAIAEKGGIKFLEEFRQWGEDPEDRWVDNIADALSRNSYLELPEIVKIAKIGYHVGIGSQIEPMVSPGMQQKYSDSYGTDDNHVIARAVYEEMKDELLDSTPREDDDDRNSLLRQQVIYLQAIARQDPKARQEIVDFLLTPEMVQRQSSRGTNNVYITALRHYLHTAGNEYAKMTREANKFENDRIIADPNTIKKIFNFHISEEAKNIIPETAPDQLLVPLADIPNLPQEIVEYFVEYTSKTNSSNSSKITNKVITSPEVDVETKKRLIYNSYMKDEQHLPIAGYRHSAYAKIFARRLMEILFTLEAELAQWILDNELLDPIFIEKWNGTEIKRTGRVIDLQTLNSEKSRELEEFVEKQKNDVQQRLNSTETAKNPTNEEPSMNEEIEKYFQTGDRGVLLEHDSIMNEIKDYFNNDEEYLKYDSHELSSLEKLLDPDSPAPWDE